MAHKQLVGIVLSNRMQKTIVVRVTRLVRHPIYQKVVRKAKKFKAFNPGIEVKIGDEVRIEETRPISKEICWRVTEVVRRGAALSTLGSEEFSGPIAAEKVST